MKDYSKMSYFFGSLGMYMGFIVWCYDGNTDALEKCESFGDMVKVIYKVLNIEYDARESFGYFREYIVPYYAQKLAEKHSWREYLFYQDPLLAIHE